MHRMPHTTAAALALSWPPWLRAGSEVLVASKFGGLLPQARPTRAKQRGGAGRMTAEGWRSARLLPSRLPAGKGSEACQPISFFRKASSWSSSLIPTNLSTTSPFLMASTVGTADTSYSMARSV